MGDLGGGEGGVTCTEIVVFHLRWTVEGGEGWWVVSNEVENVTPGH